MTSEYNNIITLANYVYEKRIDELKPILSKLVNIIVEDINQKNIPQEFKYENWMNNPISETTKQFAEDETQIKCEYLSFIHIYLDHTNKWHRKTMSINSLRLLFTIYKLIDFKRLWIRQRTFNLLNRYNFISELAKLSKITKYGHEYFIELNNDVKHKLSEVKN